MNFPLPSTSAILTSAAWLTRSPQPDPKPNPAQGTGGHSPPRLGAGTFRQSLGKHCKALAMTMGSGAAKLALLPLRMLPYTGRMISEKILEPRAERRYAKANSQWIKHLGNPRNTLAADSEAMSKLHAQAQALGNATSRQERQQLVAVGERLVEALDKGQVTGGRITVSHADGSSQSYAIASSTYTTRAICWYLMARAAREDADREAAGQGRAGVDFPSAMVVEGSTRFKDPDNRLFEFLRSAPSVGPRAATHFEEMLDAPGWHRIAGVVKRKQHWGLDDYGSKLPGKGGALVFNKLKAPEHGGACEIYLKIEAVGCPDYTHFEDHLGTLDKGFRFVAAGDRNFEHVTHFLGSRSHKDSADPTIHVQRHEHLHKGYLKKPVYTPFLQLMREAGNSPEDLRTLKRKLRRGGGFQAVEHELAQLRGAGDATSGISAKAGAFLDDVRKVRAALDGLPGGAQPAPRGAEWRPAIFTAPRAPMAPTGSGIPPGPAPEGGPADPRRQLAERIARDHGESSLGPHPDEVG